MSLQFGEDPERRRRLLWSLPQGLFVLGTRGNDDQVHLMTQSLVVQACVSPCMVAMAVESSSRTMELLDASKVAALSVLHRDQRELVRRFVKPQLDVALDDQGVAVAVAGVDVTVAPSGCVAVVGALGVLDLAVREVLALGSHSLAVCDVVSCAVDDAVLSGAASAHLAPVLRMEDTRLNYGG